MKIGIDISPIVYGSGVSAYTRNLVENLLRIDKSNRYTLFFSSLRRELTGFAVTGYGLRVILKTFKLPPTLLDILWNKLHVLPVENFVGNVDVFHASDWTQPPAKSAKLVTTIHDLSFLNAAETVHPKVYAAQKRRLKWVKKEADAVIAVSEATKTDVVELLQIDPEKVHVVYEALPEDVKKLKVESEKLKVLREKYEIEKPYILAYGSQAPRKNIERLIAAFEHFRLQNADFQLVISGEYKPEGLDEAEKKEIVVTGFLPRENYLTLLSGARALAYPSLYEGFGLPILEAFYFGVPVLTSDCSSMPEVGGDAAIYVHPTSIDSIVEGLKEATGNNVDDNIKRGRERVKEFSWEKAAKETIGIYEKIYSGIDI